VLLHAVHLCQLNRSHQPRSLLPIAHVCARLFVGADCHGSDGADGAHGAYDGRLIDGTGLGNVSSKSPASAAREEAFSRCEYVAALAHALGIAVVAAGELPVSVPGPASLAAAAAAISTISAPTEAAPAAAAAVAPRLVTAAESMVGLAREAAATDAHTPIHAAAACDLQLRLNDGPCAAALSSAQVQVALRWRCARMQRLAISAVLIDDDR
jgi:hypothetical protein